MSLEGSTIRNIRIGERLGQGGMGEVYLAEDERLGRQVAVKAVRASRRMDAAARTRFLREAQVLSQLEHPNICRIYEYIEELDHDLIVLELVRGETLAEIEPTQFGYHQKLVIAEQVVRALVAAHSLSVVHRDLKPENIMIASDGVAKVLDFGLARTVTHDEPEPDSSARRMHTFEAPPAPSRGSGGTVTQLGTVVGTPGFMSPEQAWGQPATAASDMYAFGLVLQDLFTGAPAFAENLSPTELHERTAWAETLPALGLPSPLARLIEELKAVRPKDRPTAVAACERLQAIRERPRKIRRRLVAMAVVASLVVGAVAATVGLVASRRSLAVAQRERTRADLEAASAGEVTEFLVSLFEVSDPLERQGGDVTARELLEDGAARIHRELESEPVLQARLTHTIGRVYRRMGLYGEAIELLEGAVALREEHLGAHHLESASSQHELGVAYDSQGRYDDAARQYRRALATREDQLGEEHPDVTSVINSLAGIHFYGGEFEEASVLMERIVAIEERTLGPEHVDRAVALSNLALLYSRIGREDEAESLHRRALAIREKALGPNHPTVADSLMNLANFLDARQRYDEAEPLYLRAMAIQEEVLGPEHPSIARTLLNLGILSFNTGRLDETERIYLRALAITEKSLGPTHPSLARLLTNLAGVYHHLGRLTEAESLFRRAVEIGQAAYPADHPYLLGPQRGLAGLLRSAGRIEEAETIEAAVAAAAEAPAEAD